MSEQFCLIIFRDFPDGEDDESYTVEGVSDVHFLEEPSHMSAMVSAREIWNDDDNEMPISSMKLISIDDVTVIEDWNEEAKSENEKLQERLEEMESKAASFDELMDVITEFSGTDPRKVEPDNPTRMNPCSQLTQPPLHDIAINLLHEAVRKRAKAMNALK